MRAMTKLFRLQANSLPEVVDGLAELERRFGYLLKPEGRKLKAGPILNAILVHFLELPSGRQEEILTAAFARIEELLESDTPVGLGPRPREPLEPERAKPPGGEGAGREGIAS
jgi:hypothetical protein